MRLITLACFTLLLPAIACGPEPAVGPVTARACPITAPVRLVPAPENFDPEEDAWYGLHVFGDDILYTFQRHDDPERETWHYNRCTGDLRPFPPLVPGLDNPFVIDTDEGRVVYANDAERRLFVVDRLDVAGDDAPRVVLGVPEDADVAPYRGDGSVLWIFDFSSWWQSASHAHGAAGVGASTYALYTHRGDPEAPPLRLSDALLSATEWNEADVLIHEEGGEVHRVDPRTGERERLLSGVRHVAPSPDARALIWQALGDDYAEPVYLHRVDSGDDVQIAVNELAQFSWGRDPEGRDLGEWRYTEDSAVAAMIGAEDRFVLAVHVDTGEAIEIPPHLAASYSVGGEYVLRLADDPEVALALWDPSSGRVREWYRGPPLEPGARITIEAVDGERIRYIKEDAGQPSPEALWRVDLSTGERELLLADLPSIRASLDASRYLLGTRGAPLDGPPSLDMILHIERTLLDFAVIDVDAGRTTALVDRVSAVSLIPDEGLIVIDALGADPGVWAYPFN